MPNGDHEPKTLSRFCALVAAFERRHGHWPTALKLGREARQELRWFLGSAAYHRLMERLASLPDDDAPAGLPILVADDEGTTLDYSQVRRDGDIPRAGLWLGVDDRTPHAALLQPESTDLEWDFLTDPGLLDAEVRAQRNGLATAARTGDWDAVFALLRERPAWVNAARPGGSSGFTPLHQAAYLGASEGVIRTLLDLGAWRLHRTAAGELPIDVAERRGHRNLVPLLTPRPSAPVGREDLQVMETYFHAAIRARAGDLVEEHRLRLPRLEPLQELPMRMVYLPIPGMYGGFAYWLARGAPDPLLLTASWSRVVGGSGQHHEITRYGVRLIGEGFM